MQREPISLREDTGKVLRFRPRTGTPAGGPQLGPHHWLALPGRSPVDDLAKYERPAGDYDDYRHRMLVNAIAFAFCVLLVATGIWLASKIAELRRTQDCVLSGRRNCAQISIIGNAARYP